MLIKLDVANNVAKIYNIRGKEVILWKPSSISMRTRFYQLNV